MHILITNSEIKKIGKKYYLIHDDQILYFDENKEIVLTKSLDRDIIKKMKRRIDYEVNN